LIDQFLPREWFATFHVHSGHNMEHGLPFWFEVLCSVLLSVFILNIYIKKYYTLWKSKKLDTKSIATKSPSFQIDEFIYLKVKGLDCNSCKTNMENGLSSLPDIESVEADINTSTVKIRTKNFQPIAVKEAIELLGMKYDGQIFTNILINNKLLNYKISVKGMNCNHCKANVEKVLSDIPGIKQVIVELDQSTAFFNGINIDLNLVKSKIESVGYEYGGAI